ncbi:MAG: glycosyltransferase family 2 protein [Candidatus Hydrogenedentes bacterium]|nr:glycosyltransferase family 2 protein [Candidatus Hydrogenedentota bacterium]
MKISFVIPAFNEEKTIEPLVEAIVLYSQPYSIQIILVDDGSTDSTYEEMVKMQNKYPEAIEIIKLRKNFGKSRALSAGFKNAKGDIVIMMDADLQDDPKEIPRMIKKIEEGYDLVCGWKKHRQDPWHKKIPSKIYNWMIRIIFNINLHDINTGYKAFRKETIEQIPLYGEMHRLIAVLAHELGFKVTEIPVEHHPRKFGKSKFGFNRFFHGAVDLYTVWFLSKHSQSPAYFFSKRGLIAIFIGILGISASVGGIYLTGEQLRYIFWGTISSVFVAMGFLTIGIGLIAEILRREFSIKNDNTTIEKIIYNKENKKSE